MRAGWALIALLSLPAAAAPPAPAPAPAARAATDEAARLLAETDHAIRMGRYEQARILLAQAQVAGASASASETRAGDLAFARRDWDSAYGLYRGLIARGAGDAAMAARAARAALELGRLDEAASWLDRALADEAVARDWRHWNLRGVIADRRGEGARAEAAYARGAALAPEQAMLLNNWAFSNMLRGRWAEAAALGRRAAALAPDRPLYAANRDFASWAAGAALPERRADEPAAAFAARLNDAGVAAALGGDAARARAAFTRALGISSTHYERAATNLERLDPAR
ncbi:tetratricopeptide repeat protein [Sphingomicrobium astaxanthinifaciens]|uniref:tetratricopeptide repeat protein n=1 Tax=Sphingomicrobium astaxanthinifaciens TaxID=1227949 RepID=UPI001FCC6648|nr:tetratricopeptide repeat protein [Sphingomicrobium astaxanthinifaciens]MCJ7421291.1 tetratricopeptide repeat protein [Sphingomicrobium astaxanthinifaciens]